MYRHRPTLLNQFDLSDPTTIRVLAWALPISAVAAGVAFFALAEYGVLVALAGALVAFCSGVVLFSAAVLRMAHYSARALASFVLPSGNSTPVVKDFSYEKSLVIRGQVREALASLESQITLTPGDPQLCIFAADVYSREGADPRAAERLYLRARQARGITPRQDLHAANRLVDLYLGPLESPARAAEELRRLIERHPASTAAAHAEQALRSLGQAARVTKPDRRHARRRSGAVPNRGE